MMNDHDLENAILAWLREDVPMVIKMTINRELVEKLKQRILDKEKKDD